MFEFRLYNCYYPYGERNHRKLSHFVADPKTDWGHLQSWYDFDLEPFC